MAGRTRRPSKANATDTQASEPEFEVGEAEGTDTQEEATEAPENNEEPDVATVTENTEAANEQPIEAANEQPTEAQAAEAQAVEAQAAEAQAVEAQPAEAVNKTPDEYFTEFKSTVTEAVGQSDKNTGTVPDGEMSKVLAAYKALPNTAKKSEAKAWIAEVMRETLMNKDMGGATAYANINKAVNEVGTRRAAAGATAARPQVSETEAYVTRIAALALSNKFTPQPEKLDDNWVQQFQELMDKEGNDAKVASYKEFLGAHAEWAAKSEDERGDEPTEPEGIGQVLKDAAKIGQGKAVGRRASGGTRRSSGGGGGVRRDVKKHIEEFLDQAEPGGEYPVSAIANFKSSEYPEGDASPGAVAARLFPGDNRPSTVSGFEAVTGGGTRKIRKLAA